MDNGLVIAIGAGIFTFGIAILFVMYGLCKYMVRRKIESPQFTVSTASI